MQQEIAGPSSASRQMPAAKSLLDEDTHDPASSCGFRDGILHGIWSSRWYSIITDVRPVQGERGSPRSSCPENPMVRARPRILLGLHCLQSRSRPGSPTGWLNGHRPSEWTQQEIDMILSAVRCRLLLERVLLTAVPWMRSREAGLLLPQSESRRPWSRAGRRPSDAGPAGPCTDSLLTAARRLGAVSTSPMPRSRIPCKQCRHGLQVTREVRISAGYFTFPRCDRS